MSAVVRCDCVMSDVLRAVDNICTVVRGFATVFIF